MDKRQSNIGDLLARQVEEHIRKYTSKSELHRVETQKGTSGEDIERLREAFDMVKANRPLKHFPESVELNPESGEFEKFPDSSLKEASSGVNTTETDRTTGLPSGTSQDGSIQRMAPRQEQQLSFDFGDRS